MVEMKEIVSWMQQQQQHDAYLAAIDLLRAIQKVQLELRHVTPDHSETVQGIMTGQIQDAKQAMRDLKDRMDAELDRAIAAARQKGAQAARQDWVFPNWEPTKDYTEADYKALAGK
jgi:multiple sugar transport system substrate-binding protein